MPMSYGLLGSVESVESFNDPLVANYTREALTKAGCSYQLLRGHRVAGDLDLVRLGLLAYRVKDGMVNLAVLAWAGGEGAECRYYPVFEGEGFLGLRELRHTWWGENGYIHFVNRRTIEDAFEVLSKWFDLD